MRAISAAWSAHGESVPNRRRSGAVAEEYLAQQPGGHVADREAGVEPDAAAEERAPRLPPSAGTAEVRGDDLQVGERLVKREQPARRGAVGVGEADVVPAWKSTINPACSSAR